MHDKGPQLRPCFCWFCMGFAGLVFGVAGLKLHVPFATVEVDAL